jgi:hypothetical protein
LWSRLGITAAAIAVVGLAVYYYLIAPIVLPVPAEPTRPTGGGATVVAWMPPPTPNDAKRRDDARAVQQALAAYFKVHGAYPLSPLGTTCGGTYDNLAGLAPALTPYISEIPKDPRPKACVYNYFYVSDGKNYLMMIRLDSIDGTKYGDHWCIAASAGSVPGWEAFLPCP